MTGHAPKYLKSKLSNAMTSFMCLWVLSKRREGSLGFVGFIGQPNSFGLKKAVKTKHAATPGTRARVSVGCQCSPASDVSQLFAHAKSLSDSWRFNKIQTYKSVTFNFTSVKVVYRIVASGKILCAPWQQRAERRERVSLRVGGESKGSEEKR